MLMDYLSKVADRRRAQGQRYKLKHLLLFTILSLLSGGKSYRDAARFMQARHSQLNKLFDLSWKSTPKKSQLRNVISSLDIESVESAFRGYSEALRKQGLANSHSRVGIDGKTLRGSFANEKDSTMLQLLGAFCSESALILGHVDIDEKTNEIPMAQQLIHELNLPEGSIYTLDALHCQKKPLPQQKQ